MRARDDRAMSRVSVVGHVFRCTPYDAVRVVLATVLLLAAGLKAHQLATEPVTGVGLLHSRSLLIGVVEFELFFGIWVLAGIWLRLTWVAAVACFTMFAAVALWKALAGEASCGCFGRVPVNPWYTFALDSFFVAALFQFRPTAGGRHFERGEDSHSPFFKEGLVQGYAALMPLLRLSIVVAAWLMVGIPAAIAMGSFKATTVATSGEILGDGPFVILETRTWIGKPFPLLPHIDIGQRLAQGNWVVVLYHHDCPRCQEAIPKYEELGRELARRPGTAQLAMVEMAPYGSLDDSSDAGAIACVRGRLSHAHNWFANTPVELVLEKGVVMKAHEEPSK